MVFRGREANHEILTHETVPHSTGVWFSIPRPQKYFHELAKNSLLTKILPPQKCPLYGIGRAAAKMTFVRQRYDGDTTIITR